MRLVKKENQLRFIRVADFWQIFEKLGEKPEQESRVNFGRLLHQLLRGQNVDHTLAALGLDQIVEVQSPLAEGFVGALRFEGEQITLDRAGTGGRNISVLGFKLIGVIGDVMTHRTTKFQDRSKRK